MLSMILIVTLFIVRLKLSFFFGNWCVANSCRRYNFNVIIIRGNNITICLFILAEIGFRFMAYCSNRMYFEWGAFFHFFLFLVSSVSSSSQLQAKFKKFEPETTKRAEIIVSPIENCKVFSFFGLNVFYLP